ncbi:unnamed protein product [Somion occarium]
MFAYRFNTKTQNLSREEIPIPKPRSDEVLVKVTASGVCHSDVSALYHPETVQLQVHTGGDTLTMGHEAAGTITELGSEVEEKYPELAVGTQIAMLGPNPCNEDSCEMCLANKGNLCGARGWYGLSIDGAWAGYVALRASSVVPIPPNTQILPEVVAVATDAALTTYHALKTIGNVQAGQTVVILGCGGLGQNAVQIAKHCLGAGCVIACDLREQSLEVAKEGGADHTTYPNNIENLVRRLNLSVDIVLDCVGIPSTTETAANIVKRGGRIVSVGVGAKTLQVPLVIAIGKEIQILPCVWGTKSELAEVLEAIAQGKIKPQLETRPFEDCFKVLEELRDGKLKSRVVLIP